MILAETTGSETIHYLHGLDLVAESDGAASDYFLYDGLGSARQLTDPSGEILLAQTFDPYGNLYASAGAGQSSFGYAGEYQDPSGLLYLRARYYDPAQGRFFQPDAWEGDYNRPQSLNPYMYVEGRVVIQVDPTGTQACSPSDNIGGPPCQENGNVMATPVWWEETDTGNGGYLKHELEFEPNVNFQPVRLYMNPLMLVKDWNVPESQFDIPGYTHQGMLCGPFAITAAVQNLLGLHAPGLMQVLTTIREIDDLSDGTGWYELHRLVEEIPGVFPEPEGEPYYQEYPVYSSDYRYDPKKDFYGTEIRPKLALGDRWPVAFVGFTSVGGGDCYSPSTCRLAPYLSGVGHFVVITGLSSREDYWYRDSELTEYDTSEWRWVRIHNPFTNSTEYYRASEFYLMQSGYQHGLLWIVRG
jgi:RHS repeat-associated protein